jgi:hypothetical protein
LRTLHNLTWDVGTDGCALRFPPSLTSLTYEQDVPNPATAPLLATCRGLTELNLHCAFEVPLSTFQLPSTLTRVAGVRSSQIDDEWGPPEGLLELYTAAHGLTLRSPTTPGDMRWPPQLRILRQLPGMPRGADYSKLALPETLTSIDVYGVPGMEHARWPASLREMTYEVYSSSYSGSDPFLPLKWNDGLEILRLRSYALNRPILDWHPPTSLTELEMPFSWNCPLTQLHLPPRLRKLTFGSSFNQPIRATEIEWPESLETLMFGDGFTQSLNAWTPPANLTHLVFFCGKLGPFGWSRDVRGLASFTAKDIRVPPSLRRFKLMTAQTPPLRFSPEEWPQLEYLELDQPPVSWSNTLLPPRLQSLRVCHFQPESVESFLRDFQAPAHLVSFIVDPPCSDFSVPPLEGRAIRRMREHMPTTCAFLRSE